MDEAHLDKSVGRRNPQPYFHQRPDLAKLSHHFHLTIASRHCTPIPGVCRCPMSHPPHTHTLLCTTVWANLELRSIMMLPLYQTFKMECRTSTTAPIDPIAYMARPGLSIQSPYVLVLSEAITARGHCCHWLASLNLSPLCMVFGFHDESKRPTPSQW